MDFTTLPANSATYAKRAIAVTATRVDVDTPVDVSWQDEPLTAFAGDMVVTDGASSWPVGAEIFKATYRANDDGTFAKVATIEAVRIDEDFTVTTREGQAKGRAGDWLARGVAGELWPIPADTFEANYTKAGA